MPRASTARITMRSPECGEAVSTARTISSRSLLLILESCYWPIFIPNSCLRLLSVSTLTPIILAISRSPVEAQHKETFNMLLRDHVTISSSLHHSLISIGTSATIDIINGSNQ